MQELKLKIHGLYTHPDDLSAVPEGALSVADDVNIDKEQVAEPRRGFDRLTYGFSTDVRANKLFFYQDEILAHYSTNSLAYYDTGSGWTNYSGTYTPPTGQKLRAAEASQNFYFTSSEGVQKLDAYNGTPVDAGVAKGLDAVASIPASVTSAWLTDAYAVAYRIVWGYRDANNNLILGSPSHRTVVTNSSGAASDVDVEFSIPDDATTSWLYQIYRAAAVDNSTGSVEPNDEMGLVYEGNPTSGEITAGTITVNDITPDELRGATIYTAATQEGLANANEQPPLCDDIAIYKNVMFYANTQSRHRYTITLLGAGGTNGLAVDDTIVVDGVTYTAKTSETIATPEFRVYLSGTFDFVDGDVNTGDETITETAHGLQDDDVVTLTTTGTLPAGLATATTYYVVSAATNTLKLSLTKGGSAVNITAAAGGGTHTATYGNSASQNIADTARSLARVINRHASSTVYAYYLSGPDDLPGKLLLEKRTLGGAAFTTTTDNATAWSPDASSGEASSNDAYKNGIFFSKVSEPEAVPLGNFFFVGSADEEIMRIIPLRDSLFVLKEDGIYRLSGEDPSSFRVDLFDSTTRILASDTAAVLNNQIFVLSDQGVVAITESGVQVKSRPIENTLLGVLGANRATLIAESFAVSYESERKYIMFVPRLAGDTTPTQAFVYNTFTNSWTRWVLSKKCGGVNPADDKLYFGDANSEYTDQERKALDFTDHADFRLTATISAVSGTTVTIGSTDSIEAGDVIYEDANTFATVESVDSDAGTVVVDVDTSFSLAAATVYKAISSKIAWVPATLGNPGTLKQFREATMLFKTDLLGDASLLFSSDRSASQETETLTGRSTGLWGMFGWGGVPWGGAVGRQPIRVWVPRNKQRATQLSVEFRHARGFTNYQLSGISLVANQLGERVAY